MNHIPFLYINVSVLCCFLLMFVTILAVKKTPEIWAFLAVLVDVILWAGGSVLMRLQFWPGMRFWYAVSLVALFIMELLFYIFIHVFTRRKGKLLLSVFVLWNAAIIPGTISGFFLEMPRPVSLENGDTVFLYSLNWHIIIPCIMFVCIIAATVAALLQAIREQGAHSPGIQMLVASGLIMLVGNLLQVSIPGNTFPFDMLSGLVFAALLIYTLYRRRLFRMTLVVSRSLLAVTMAAVCVTFAANLIGPMYEFSQQRLGLDQDWSITTVAVTFAGVLAVAYVLVRRLLDAVFIREEQQNKLVKKFSAEVSQTLSTADIMEKLGGVIACEIPVEQIYVCLLEGNAYQARYCSSPLATLSFSISKDRYRGVLRNSLSSR